MIIKKLVFFFSFIYLQTYKEPWKEVNFLLAVYRECTMKYKSEKQYLSQVSASLQI